MKVPLAGGTPTPIASGQVGPQRIAVDSTSVYWTTSTTVMKAPLGGGTLTTLASGQDRAFAIAVDSRSVYWTTINSTGTVMKATPK